MTEERRYEKVEADLEGQWRHIICIGAILLLGEHNSSQGTWAGGQVNGRNCYEL
jgi:hypothetical protein